jgi:signal peptidase I
MKIFYTIFYSIFIALLLGIVLLFFVPVLPIDNNIAIKIVESGSMEPAITTGSIVVIRPAASYAINDVITFESASAEVPTTHRIIATGEENGVRTFSTKGDANEEADTQSVYEDAVLGKVILAVPYVGFVLDFARQPLGFSLLIVLPALLIILGEIEKIWKEVRARRRIAQTPVVTEELEQIETSPSTKPMVKMMDIRPFVYVETVPKQLQVVAHRQRSVLQEYIFPIVIVLTSFLFASMSFTGSTVSYFNDLEASLANLLKASIVDFGISPTDAAHVFLNAPGDEFEVVLTIVPLLSSTALEYNLRVEKVSGSDAFCAALVADAGTPIVYSGSLLPFTAGGVTFVDPWTFGISIDPQVVGYAASDTCVVDIVFDANHLSNTTALGYSDSEKIRLTLTAPLLAEQTLVPVSTLFVAESISEEVTEEEPLVEGGEEEVTETESIPMTDESAIGIPVETEAIEQIEEIENQETEQETEVESVTEETQTPEGEI